MKSNFCSIFIFLITVTFFSFGDLIIKNTKAQNHKENLLHQSITLRNENVLNLSIKLTEPETDTEERRKGALVIKVENIKRDKGNICILLFNKSDGYPKEREKAIMSDFRPVNGQKSVTFELEQLNYGKYAVAVLHDENNNNKMDYNMIGIPKEGMGFFKVSGSIFKAPAFEETSVSLHAPRKEEKVVMIYM